MVNHVNCYIIRLCLLLNHLSNREMSPGTSPLKRPYQQFLNEFDKLDVSTGQRVITQDMYDVSIWHVSAMHREIKGIGRGAC